MATFLILVGLKLTAVDVILVDLDVRVALLRQIIHHENGCHRTDRYTGAAINALSRIDIQLRHFIERRSAIVIGSALCRMDAIHRAHVHTRSIFGPDTGFGDDVGHGSPPCVDRICLRKTSILLRVTPGGVNNQIHRADPNSNPSDAPAYHLYSCDRTSAYSSPSLHKPP